MKKQFMLGDTESCAWARLRFKSRSLLVQCPLEMLETGRSSRWVMQIRIL